MNNEELKQEMINDCLTAYQNFDAPKFYFLREREDWYNDLIKSLESISKDIYDNTDLNYDYCKSIEIDRNTSDAIYLYLSLVGKYAFLIGKDGCVISEEKTNTESHKNLLKMIEMNKIKILSKAQLLGNLPITIKLEEDLSSSKILAVLFAPELMIK